MRSADFFATLQGSIPKVVGRTVEFDRVYNLPRRKTFPDLRDLLTEILLLPNVDPKEHSLRLHQAWALAEAVEQGGSLGNLGVGLGKTLLTLLLPVVFEMVQRPVIIVPGGLYDKTQRDFEKLRKVWRSHPNTRILTYGQLSRKGGQELLEKYVPDMVVADEVHWFKNTEASCTRKMARWMEAHEDTIFCGYSGTVATRSLHDCSHIAYWALKERSPLPKTLSDRILWALATDDGVPDEKRPDPGALKLFCEPGESIRLGLRRRILETPGFIASESPLAQTPDGTDISLNVITSSIKLDTPAIRDVLASYRATGILGDEVSINALETSRHLNELALGLYNVWVWPNGKKDEEWIERRKQYRKYVRKVIRYSSQSNHPFDSEEQVELAIKDGILIPPNDEYNAWAAVRGRYVPVTEARWIDDSLVRQVGAWLHKHPIGRIAWVSSKGFIARFKQLFPDIPVYEAGDNRIGQFEKRARSCLASLAHAVGKNLQYGFYYNLVVELPPTADDWEQLFGRTHRSGQPSEEVTTEIVMSTIESYLTFEKVRSGARWFQDQWGSHQRLNYATVVTPSELDIIKLATARPPNPLWVKEWAVTEE